MALRFAALCAALVVVLVQTPAPARACEGSACQTAAKSTAAKSKAPGKPLKLGKFMRPGGAKKTANVADRRNSAAAQAHTKSRKRAPVRAAAAPIEPAPTPLPRLPVDAADALAAQPAEPVRVVSSDEINGIDRTAGPLPPATDGMGLTTEHNVQLVDAGDYNEIDRQSDQAHLAYAMSTPAPAQSAAEPTGQSWIERFWGWLQHTFVAIGTAVRSLFG